MHKFNDLNQTVVLTNIIAFQLNADNKLAFSWEITLILENTVTLTMYYPKTSDTDIEKYHTDCKHLLSL